MTTTLCSVESASMMLQSPDFNPKDFLSIREFLCGGERVPRNVREFLKSQLIHASFGVAYGSTECGVITNYDREADTSGIEDNVVGNVTRNAMIKIVDIDDKKPLGVNEVGEVYAMSETMFSVNKKLKELNIKRVKIAKISGLLWQRRINIESH